MSKKDETSKLEEQFQIAYDKLNTEQREAVDTIEGPVMVVAGPGTGKTQILTLRIANILLQTDVNPENILALTFTESGATAMRERLRRYVGPVAYRVPIKTFHSFCGELIRQYPQAYQTVVGGRPANDLEKISLIETILNSGDFKLLRPMGNPAYYVMPLLRELGEMKKEYITPDTFAEIISRQEAVLGDMPKVHVKGAHKGKVRGDYTKLEKSIAKNYELLNVYRQYQALLQEQQLFDFEDMIIESIASLESNEDMLRDLQESYQYLLADEHQDVNGSQNKILELLASYHERPNIFAVGDEKQAIYRFQGASLENFLYFEDLFPGTKTIALTQNYRSGQTILDAAHSLVAVEDGPLAELRIPLTAAAVTDSSLELREFTHQAVEDDWMVSQIQDVIKEGVAAAEIAVIVRTNREVEAMAERLRTVGIPVVASAEGDIARHPVTIGIRSLLEAVLATKDESALFRVVQAPYWGFSMDDVMRIVSARSYKQSLRSILSSEEKLKELGVVDFSIALQIIEVLDQARRQSASEPPHQVLQSLLQQSGFLEYVVSSNSIESTRVVRRLYDEIESMVVQKAAGTLEDICTLLDRTEAYNLPLNAPFIASDAEAVQVMTAHKSKGLEFEVVFMPHVTDSQWGARKSRNNFEVAKTKHIETTLVDAEDDERRLLYVSLTRAKSRLLVSSASTNQTGKELLPSRLIEQIDSTYVSAVETDKEESSFDPLHVLSNNAKEKFDVAAIARLTAERGFSATSINNYLQSPWNYIYRNLLRVPEAQPLPMLFGTAVHGVLERSVKYFKDNESKPADSDIKTWLDNALGRLPVNDEQYTTLHQKGFEAVLAYVPTLYSQISNRSQIETSIKVMLSTGLEELPEIPLSGKLDRIDFGEDGMALRVVDYKTGKPKTRNVIEGKTQTSDGGYKRQLVFYALLLSLQEDDRTEHCREGVLSFVEPDTKGVVHEESFVVTDEEIEVLKGEIITATKDLLSGGYLDTQCDSEKSDYCELAKQLYR